MGRKYRMNLKKLGCEDVDWIQGNRTGRGQMAGSCEDRKWGMGGIVDN
jgi:hypothetical protein